MARAPKITHVIFGFKSFSSRRSHPLPIWVERILTKGGHDRDLILKRARRIDVQDILTRENIKNTRDKNLQNIAGEILREGKKRCAGTWSVESLKTVLDILYIFPSIFNSPSFTSEPPDEILKDEPSVWDFGWLYQGLHYIFTSRRFESFEDLVAHAGKSITKAENVHDHLICYKRDLIEGIALLENIKKHQEKEAPEYFLICQEIINKIDSLSYCSLKKILKKVKGVLHESKHLTRKEFSARMDLARLYQNIIDILHMLEKEDGRVKAFQNSIKRSKKFIATRDIMLAEEELTIEAVQSAEKRLRKSPGRVYIYDFSSDD